MPKAIIILLTILYFTFSVAYNKNATNDDIFWKVFFFTKEELLIIGLCLYSYLKATNSYSIFCTVSIGCYSIIQMTVYIMTSFFVKSTIEYSVILNDPWVSISSSIVCASIILVINWLFKWQHQLNIKYLINQIK